MRHPVDYAPSQDFGDNPTSILPASHWIIQQFGNYQPDGHTGTDYPCPIGTPVRAAADGKVLHVGRLSGSYADNPWWISPSFAGYTYVVDHGHFIGIYGHCMDGGARVRQGQSVIEGQVLGLSGNTGASTGPHLHFEALPDGYVLNGYMYGRINPATLFRGVQPQSAPITPQEDDLSDAQYAALTQKLDSVLAALISGGSDEPVSVLMYLKKIDAKLADISWDEHTKTSQAQELANIKILNVATNQAVKQILDKLSK